MDEWDAEERVVIKRRKELQNRRLQEERRRLNEQRKRAVREAMVSNVSRERYNARRSENRQELISDAVKIFGDPARTLECETCHVEKGVGDYMKMRSELDPHAPSPQVCDHCRDFGPPVRDPTAKLTPQELYAMEVLFAGGSIRDAAQLSGIDNSDLSKMVRGKVMPHFRAALQAILNHEGLTPRRLANAMFDALGAEMPKWNPMTKEGDYFPDHSNRRSAARDLLKMMGADEPKEQSVKSGDIGGISINILTNVGSNTNADPPGTLIARARQAPAIEAEYEESNGDAD